jgi:hypothetical protein
MTEFAPIARSIDADVQKASGIATCARFMLEEILDVAAPDQIAAFLHSVGGRIAIAYPVGSGASNAEIFDAINAAWAESGLGASRITFAPDGLHIDHDGLPPAPFGMEAKRWRVSLIAVLEGAYASWFGTLGAAADFRMHVVQITVDGAEFRYGP